MTSAGAIPTTVKLAPNAAVEKVSVFQSPPKKAYDPNFQLDTETYEGSAAFLLELHLKPDAAPGAAEISAEVRYQTCNDTVCIPPRRRTASATLTIDPAAHAAASAIPAGYSEWGGPPGPRATPGRLCLIPRAWERSCWWLSASAWRPSSRPASSP